MKLIKVCNELETCCFTIKAENIESIKLGGLCQCNFCKSTLGDSSITIQNPKLYWVKDKKNRKPCGE